MPPPSKKRKAGRRNAQLSKFYSSARRVLGLKKPSEKFEENGEIDSGLSDEPMVLSKSLAAKRRNLALARRRQQEIKEERKAIREAIKSGRLVLNVPLDTLPEWVRNDVVEDDIKLEPIEEISTDSSMIRRQMTPMSAYEVAIQREKRQKARMNEIKEAISRAPFLRHEPIYAFPQYSSNGEFVYDEDIKLEPVEGMNSSMGSTSKAERDAEIQKILELSRIRREQNREESKAIENGKLFSIYEREAIEEAAQQRQLFYMDSSDLRSEHPESLELEESVKLEDIDEDPSTDPFVTTMANLSKFRVKMRKNAEHASQKKREAIEIQRLRWVELMKQKSIINGNIAHDHCYLARFPPSTNPPADQPPSLAPQTTTSKSYREERNRREYEKRLNEEAAARVEAIRRATVQRILHQGEQMVYAQTNPEFFNDIASAARPSPNQVTARNTMLEGLESERRRSEVVREPKVEWLEEKDGAQEVVPELKIEVKEEIEYEMAENLYYY
ncbi:unnamed protein product [Caenorhabditis brenneri]